MMNMKIHIVYDNTAYLDSLLPDWGFSCVIEGPYIPKILFDTGAKGQILLYNMDTMGIDPRSIDIVFISHAHFDHTGGLDTFLQINSRAQVYVPKSLTSLRHKNVVSVNNAQQVADNALSTGELGGIEQSLLISANNESTLITGCSHPGLGKILKAASKFGKVSGIVGGLHGFSELDMLNDISWICPTHCTIHKADIANTYPQKYVPGGAGQVINC